MLNLNHRISRRFPVEEAIRAAVSRHLGKCFRDGREGFASLDKWTERRIRAENMAKIDLVLEADDPGEHCYQNLIRELDIEAENGIFLVGTEYQDDRLRALAEDPGISGELHLEVPVVAQSLFR